MSKICQPPGISKDPRALSFIQIQYPYSYKDREWRERKAVFINKDYMFLRNCLEIN